MHKKLSHGLQYLLQHLKDKQISSWLKRLYNYSSDLWFMFSTPILSNGGTNRGLPISCFLNYVPDSRDGLSSHYDENIWLASTGGGIGGYWGDIRSNGIATANNSRSHWLNTIYESC